MGKGFDKSVDWFLNIATGVVGLSGLLLVGYVLGLHSGQAKLDQAVAAQRAQSLRDFAEYPLGHAQFFFTSYGIMARCER
jgi:hypothetical protein